MLFEFNPQKLQPRKAQLVPGVGKCLPLTAVSVREGSCCWKGELGRAVLEESWSWVVAALPHFWLGFCCCSSKCFIYFQTGLCEFGVSCFLSLSQIQALIPSHLLLGQHTCCFAASPLSDLCQDLCVALLLFWGIGKIACLRRRAFFWVFLGGKGKNSLLGPAHVVVIAIHN